MTLADTVADRADRADALIAEFSVPDVRMGALKARAKEIKTDHALAQALWASGQVYPRMLAVLVMDKKQLDQAAIEALATDMADHPDKQRDHLSEWLLANQLMKDKRLAALVEG
jgi:3-methyladenine DNA glycosylase AlkD